MFVTGQNQFIEIKKALIPLKKYSDPKKKFQPSNWYLSRHSLVVIYICEQKRILLML